MGGPTKPTLADPTWDIESIIGDAEPAESTSIICIKGSLRAEYDLLEAQLQGAARVATNLAGDQAAIAAAERLAELAEEMRTWERPFHLRAIAPRKRWRNLNARRPVKTPGMDDDDYADLYHPWLCTIVAATLVSPVCTPEQVERLADKLSDGDWSKLANDAWNVNDKSANIPFSAAASVLTRSSGAKSKQHEPPENPAHGSLAGNPEPSPSTSTKTDD